MQFFRPAQIDDIRIFIRIVHKLVVRHMEKSIDGDVGKDWKHAEEVGDEVVGEPVLKEGVV